MYRWLSIGIILLGIYSIGNIFSPAYGWAMGIYYFGDKEREMDAGLWNHDNLTFNIEDRVGNQTLRDSARSAVYAWQFFLQRDINSTAFNLYEIGPNATADIRIILRDDMFDAGGRAFCPVLDTKPPTLYHCRLYIGTTYAEWNYTKEDWDIKADTVQFVYNVVLHEMGHALALGHAICPTNMPPYEIMRVGIDQEISESFLPTRLDIQALRAIYLDDGFGGKNAQHIPISFEPYKINLCVGLG